MNHVMLAGGFEGGDEQFALIFSPSEYCGFSSCSSGLPSIVPVSTSNIIVRLMIFIQINKKINSVLVSRVSC